jgi:RNA polymerase sigma factor (sigma-70 family)
MLAAFVVAEQNHMREEGTQSELVVLEDEARLAIAGNRGALERVVRSLQGDIYGLALRMLCNREDAADATQEILVRIVTRLSQFDFRSKLKTWVYRVAVNYIMDVRKSAIERLHLSFERFAEDLTGGLDPEGPAETEHSLLIEEVKVACTLGMLQCLDRPHRLAYVLGEILEMSGPEAASVLDISPSLFRKRLQHAREAILSFTRRYCGLASNTAPCSCNRQMPAKYVRIAATSQLRLLLSSKRAIWSGKSMRRAGRSKCIAPAIRGLRQLTSRGVWPPHSTCTAIQLPNPDCAALPADD